VQRSLLDLHQENFALPGEPGMEMIVLSAAAGSASEDGLRLLAALALDTASDGESATARDDHPSSQG
jgi:hypothetical protein